MILRRALATICALVAAMPASAAPGGVMATLSQGRWTCELPGDATTPPTPQPEGNFSIIPDSSYTAIAGGRGTYLLLGNVLTMTRGPYAGQRFERVGGATVIRLGPDGKRLPERCVRAGAVRDAMADGAGTP